MRDYDFLSNSKYIKLPTSKNPKVTLDIGNALRAKNSFELYNPFSRNGKVFKVILNILIPLLRPFIKESKCGIYLRDIKKYFKKEFTSSIYYSTDRSKIVVQLQSDEVIFGYLKVPLNRVGELYIKNEIRAYRVLKGSVDYRVEAIKLEEVELLFIENIDGKSDYFHMDREFPFLKKLYKRSSYLLKSHPRYRDIEGRCRDKNLLELLNTLQNRRYYEVYEHGDFAPWNIKRVGDRYSIFDFEYFIERGIEYLDLIKYHYQYLYLVKQNSLEEIFNFLLALDIPKDIITLFYINEAIENMEVNRYLKGLKR